ncbi:Bax inhibitor 1 [Branchiostoma belcheri]|nr:Bax inhibitor 1 [Branchiostoma belcheri]
MTSGHDQTWQGQSETITESLDARNLSYGTGPTASHLNSLYTTATEMTSRHDQTRQGQSETITKSNTNTTAVMTSGEYQIEQGQSLCPTVTNLSLNEVLAALQENPMYVDVTIPPKNTASTETAGSSHDQTG